MIRSWTITIVAVALFAGQAAAHPTDAQLETWNQQVTTVMKRLLQKMEPAKGVTWKPQWQVVRGGGPNVGTYNAWANVTEQNGEIVPMISITYGYMEVVVAGDMDLLALILAHELGHHHHGHTLAALKVKPMVDHLAASRQDEYDADLFGAKLMLKADFSLRNALAAGYRGFDRLKAFYSSLKALEADHPGRTDRYTRLAALLDNSQLALWQCMGAFETGADLLALHQFDAAELCFARVKKEFPKCYEAWVNLGIAKLMRYCEQLSAEELRELGVGPLAGGCFYSKADSLALTRGPREENRRLWEEAVNALKMALTLKPGLALAHANLGLAYLVHPDGREVDIVVAAEKYLQAAIDGVSQDESLDDLTRPVLLLNLAIARLAGGDRATGLQLLAQASVMAEGIARKMPRDQVIAARVQSQIIVPAAFHRARALEALGTPASRSEAARLFERFLRGTNPSSAWWRVAYDRYRAACAALGEAAQDQAALQSGRPVVRTVASVTLASGTVIALGDQLVDVIRRLGPAAREARVPSASLRRLSFPAHGIDVLADESHVIGLFVVAADVPGLVVRGDRVDGGVNGLLKVGMKRSDVEGLPGGTDYVHRPLLGFDRFYHYYPALGIAIRYDRPGPDGVVLELIVMQIPAGDF